MDKEAPPVFTNKEYWDDCVTPSNNKNRTKCLTYNAWNGAMKKAYAALNLTYKKTTHVFRSSGSSASRFSECHPDLSLLFCQDLRWRLWVAVGQIRYGNMADGTR